MGLAVEFEGLLSYGGLFSQPGNLGEAKTWLAAEQRRLGILAQTLKHAEASGNAHNVEAHKAAYDSALANVEWLTQVEKDLTAHNARIAPMQFGWGAYIAEPLAYLTGGWKKWFEKA